MPHSESCSHAAASGVVVGGAGNIYLGGFFAGTGVNLRTLGAGMQTLSSIGPSDALLIMLDAAFNIVWTRNLGSTFGVAGYDLAIDANDHLYLTGSATGAAGFLGEGAGPILFNNNNSSSINSAYVLEVDTDGNAIAATVGTGHSIGTSIDVNRDGRAAIDGLADAGAGFGSSRLPNAGMAEFLVASLSHIATNSKPAPAPSPPTFVGEHRLTVGKGRHRKISGFELDFSSALDAPTASDIGHYAVTQPGPTGKSRPKVIRVLSATPGANGTAVTLVLGKSTATKPFSLTASGLMGAGGTTVAAVVTRL
jgi:hypothetical protein